MEKKQNFFDGKKWGVFGTYLTVPAGDGTGEYCSAEAWNRQIEAFDAELLARSLYKAGAEYLMLTIGQNSGHYCSPNPVYDRLVGIRPSKCSRRDLIADLAGALEKYSIDLGVYLPSGAPCADAQAVEKLEWEWNFTAGQNHWGGPTTGHRLASFQRKWEAVIREWSVRWGETVKFWWLDGCYFPKDMYDFPEAPNFASLAAAARAGNPKAAVAFNKGLDTPFLIQSASDDFTAGEIGESLPIPSEQDLQRLKGKKLHALSYLGRTWGEGEPRFPDELAAGYTKLIVQKGGVVTWDVPLCRNGGIPEAFLRQMQAISAALK